jgi:hypothetical protein
MGRQLSQTAHDIGKTPDKPLYFDALLKLYNGLRSFVVTIANAPCYTSRSLGGRG